MPPNRIAASKSSCQFFTPEVIVTVSKLCWRLIHMTARNSKFNSYYDLLCAILTLFSIKL